MRSRRAFWMFIAVLSLVATFFFAQEAAQKPADTAMALVSKFGQYAGFSEAKYASWVRTSQYITMRDGVRLAIDIVRPAKNGKATEERLPVVWTHNRYRRAFMVKDRLISIADSYDIQNLLEHGYIAASADSRGSGASFGKAVGVWTPEETQDAYEITEWLAKQPWCDGKIGMFGGSYLGVTQLMAASRKPPHLKAIIPAVPMFDLYAFGAQGGILKDDLVRTWGELTRVLDLDQIAAAVDGDKGSVLLKKAIEDHKGNRPLIAAMSPLKFRNSRDDLTGSMPYLVWQPAGYIKEINEAGIPIYLWCGWYDAFTRDGFLMFRNFSVPKKLTIGAWSHSPKDADILKEEFTLLSVETWRWFDYWLKSIDNGIMNDPPIHYQMMVGPKQNIWMTAAQWPLPEAKMVSYYFGEGPSKSAKSSNDGILSKKVPLGADKKDVYKTDYTATTGTTTRWDNTVGGGFGYPDMAANDVKGLTYTSAPLTGEVAITGHPVARLWAASTAADADVFAYLENVDSQGISLYVTEGVLRASHRAIQDPPYDNLGLPYHRSFDTDVKDLVPGEPVELVFDLEPTSKVFKTGTRIRLTVTCADKDNAATPIIDPPPTVSVYRDAAHPSSISLPVVSSTEKEAMGKYSLVTIFFLTLVIIVLVIAFTLFVRARMRKP
jgi:putative CocE/NonD family hydrolase